MNCPVQYLRDGVRVTCGLPLRPYGQLLATCDRGHICEPPEMDQCPNHGPQEVTGHGTTRGSDPYAVNKLACRCWVVCMGPGEPNVVVRTAPHAPMAPVDDLTAGEWR